MPPATKRKPGRPRKPAILDSALDSPAVFTASPAAHVDPVVTMAPPISLASTIKATGIVHINPEEAETEEKIRVWMGTTDECPYWTVHAGGADFPRYNEIVEADGESGQTRRERHRGKVVDLSRADIEMIARAVGSKAIRKNGARSFILNLGSERYRAQRNDRPLGEFVYMQVLNEKQPHDWRTSDPETMV